MLKHALALTALLLPVGGIALAQQNEAQPQQQEQPPADDQDTTTEVQNEQTQSPPGEIAPDPRGAANQTGGVTAPAREMLPGEGSGEGMGPDATESAQSPEDQPGMQPAAGTPGVAAVGPEMVKELWEMALEQQKLTSKPAEPESEDAKQAKQQAIEVHRQSVFSRADERKQQG